MRIIPFLLILGCQIAAAQSWVQLPDFPGTARDDAASFHGYDKIFVGTGLDVGFQLTNDWYSYSLIAQSWQTVASLPASGRQYCNGFRLSDEMGYLFGGVDASGPLNELWRYDPLSDIWMERASLPALGRFACAVLVFDDHVLVCGGMLANGIPTNEVWRYDRSSDTWSQRASMPGPARHRATTMDNMVIGGADSSFQALADVLMYSSFTDSWSVGTELPEPRFASASTTNLVFCGASSLDLNHNTVFTWNWQNDSWNSGSAPPFPGGPRKGGIGSTQSSTVGNGVVFYGLGINGPLRSSDWWRLDLPTGLHETQRVPFTLHPNPASDQFILGNLPEEKWTTCTLLDGSGRVVLEERFERGSAIGTAHLKQGRYLVRLASDQHLLHTSLIILR